MNRNWKQILLNDSGLTVGLIKKRWRQNFMSSSLSSPLQFNENFQPRSKIDFLKYSRKVF